VQVRGGPAAVIGDAGCKAKASHWRGPLRREGAIGERSESQKTCWRVLNEGRNPMEKGFGEALRLPDALQRIGDMP